MVRIFICLDILFQRAMAAIRVVSECRFGVYDIIQSCSSAIPSPSILVARTRSVSAPGFQCLFELTACLDRRCKRVDSLRERFCLIDGWVRWCVNVRVRVAVRIRIWVVSGIMLPVLRMIV